MKYYIYGLSSSEDGIIRYVGQTKNNIKNRLNEHKCDALTKKLKSHKCNWIRKVYRDGFEIKISLIEETDEKHWQEREIYWIQEYRKTNKLLNQLDGGECGGIGGKYFQYSYSETKDLLKKMNFSFKNFKEYKSKIKEQEELKKFFPLNPKKVFSARNEWVSWGDFLGNAYVSDQEKHNNILTYELAKNIVRERKISDMNEYQKLSLTRNDLPLWPNKAYKNKGWNNWYDFLGKTKIVKCSYETFCRYLSIHFNKLITRKKYEEMFTSGKLSKKLPYHPDRIYGKTWTNIKRDIG